MKFRILLSALLLAAGLVSVVRGEEVKRPDTPTEVVKKFQKGINELDFAAVVRLCDGKMKNDAEELFKQIAELKATADQGNSEAKQAYEQGKALCAKMKIEVKSEKIEGDFAVLDTVMSDPNTSSKEKFYLKKVDGEWKIIDKEDYRPAAK